LHAFKTDALNDSPLINISFWVKEFSSETTGQFNKELRLKAKAFIRKLEDPAFTTSGYLFFELLKEIPSPKQSPQAEQFDWDTYKKQPFTKKITLQDNPVQNIIIRKAHLPDFIDLHIEKLEPGYEALSNAEKLAAQLRHCRTFLENAIAARLDRVYLVHGIGKGILKKEIENLLGTYPEIISYHNQYNPRFGFGATEVLLQKVL
jgi:DNA-nicking Smr family endonuclease